LSCPVLRLPIHLPRLLRKELVQTLRSMLGASRYQQITQPSRILAWNLHLTHLALNIRAGTTTALTVRERQPINPSIVVVQQVPGRVLGISSAQRPQPATSKSAQMLVIQGQNSLIQIGYLGQDRVHIAKNPYP